MTRTLDPAIARFLDEAAAADAPPITAGSVADARAANAAFLQAMATGGDEVAAVLDLTVEGEDGPLPARRYLPLGEAACHVVFFHGGGWVLGDLDGHDQLCRQVCARAKAIVTHVNYRHAPEHPFPAPALDAGRAVRALAHDYKELPLAVMGDSSGGNLAASAAIQARDEGIELAAQVLLYPVLDANFETESYRQNADGFLLTRADMKWFWDQYAPNKEDRDDPLASPLKAADLAGVAPAVLVLAGFDPLLDEGQSYAARLRAAGSSVDVVTYDAMVHGFSTLYALTSAAEESVDAVIDRLAALVAAEINAPQHKENS